MLDAVIDVSHFRRCGEIACKFIAKPFDMAEFVRIVHACKELCGASTVDSN